MGQHQPSYHSWKEGGWGGEKWEGEGRWGQAEDRQTEKFKR